MTVEKYPETVSNVHLKKRFCISRSVINFASKSGIALNNWVAEALVQMLYQFASLLEAHLIAIMIFITSCGS